MLIGLTQAQKVPLPSHWKLISKIDKFIMLVTKRITQGQQYFNMDEF